MGRYFVYVLRCSDGSYYTGVTNDWEARLAQHQNGEDTSCYTYKRRPLKLVHLAEFRDVLDAIAFEKQVKGWSRKKKEALIRKEYEKLPELASCLNATNFTLYKPIVCHTERSRSATHDVLSRSPAARPSQSMS